MFQYEIESLLVYILYVYKEKLCFSMCDKKFFWFKYFNLKRKDNIFLMWDKKIFWKNLLKFIIYNMYNLHPHELFLKFLMWEFKTLFFFNFPKLTKVYRFNPRVGSNNYGVRLVFYSLIVFSWFYLIILDWLRNKLYDLFLFFTFYRVITVSK